jgi:hypothetical protein
MANHDLSFATVSGPLIVMVVSRESPGIAPMWVLPAQSRAGGAIVGSLVAANARAAELEEIMRTVDYRRFQDGPRWRDLFFGKAAAPMFRQGIYEGQFVKD